MNLRELASRKQEPSNTPGAHSRNTRNSGRINWKNLEEYDVFACNPSVLFAGKDKDV